MKALFTVLFTILLTSTIWSLIIVREGGLVKIPEIYWDAFRDSAVITKLESKSKDTIIISYERALNLKVKESTLKDSVIKNQTSEIENCNKQIDVLLPSNKPEPFMKWDGFYAGYMASYRFQDSIITQASFLQGIQSSFYGEAVLRIKDIMITPGILIPLSKNPVSIYAKIGYRLF